MVDIHCHILPKLDDGPKQQLDFLAMAKAAVQNGISHIYATPHHRNGQYENTKLQILDSVAQANHLLQQENIPLVLHPGQELRIHRELFHSLEMGEVLTLDYDGKYLLLELPSGEVPKYTREIVYELLIRGIQPIIVHPERNRCFTKSPNLLFELVQEGALTQLTSGSIIGQFGKKIKAFAERIIEHQLAHFVATDAHNTHARGFTLYEAYETISRKSGISVTSFLKENAKLLLAKEEVKRAQRISFRKKVLGVF